MSHAARRASTALQTAETAASSRFRSPSRFAQTVATMVPIVTGHRVLGPRAIRMPEATPAADKNSPPRRVGEHRKGQKRKKKRKQTQGGRQMSPSRTTPAANLYSQWVDN